MVVKILVGAALLLLAGFLLIPIRRAWQGATHFLNGLRNWFGG